MTRAPVRIGNCSGFYGDRLSALREMLTDEKQSVLSKRGSALADIRSNKLFVMDTPSRLDEVRQMIAQIDIPVRQVLISSFIIQ